MEDVLHSRGVQGLSKIIGLDQTGSKKKMLCRIVNHVFPSSGTEVYESKLDERRPSDSTAIVTAPIGGTDVEECDRMDIDCSQNQVFTDISCYKIVSEVSFCEFDEMVQQCKCSFIMHISMTSFLCLIYLLP